MYGLQPLVILDAEADELPMSTPSEWLTVAFKVVDSYGTESNTQYAYFECALGNYPDD